MYKTLILSCVLSVAMAGIAPVHVAHVKTIVEPHVSIVETPTVAHVGSVVKSIPTGHSYQSQTQYHSKQVVQPIYTHGVEKKIISTPVVKSVVEHVPVVRHHVAKTIVAEPLAYHHAYPVAEKIVASPLHYSAVHAAPLTYTHSHAAPLAYTHSHAAPIVTYAHGYHH